MVNGGARIHSVIRACASRPGRDGSPSRRKDFWRRVEKIVSYPMCLLADLPTASPPPQKSVKYFYLALVAFRAVSGRFTVLHFQPPRPAYTHD